ncbi:ribonuclease P [Cokeromyces recurvatus]|uniref:ribonuclease P n=1 Tax=Cokeromyces recurvatus TaxID=90255 RepID=UPI00221FD595|nr:ribonuclease P [Cokeromyces recurvatus]KAI7906683.1 ribonuclease P [Cokeromyces recurvatus]
MHSLDTNLNSDDVVVLTSQGELIFSLIKNTFETFGIEALTRTKADIKHDKHIIKIDLKKKCFQVGSKEFNRLKWCLENTLTRNFNMVFCATDALTGTTVDIQWPTMVSKISKKEMKAELETLMDINIPSFEPIAYPLNEKADDWDNLAMEALEWLGLAHLKANRIKRNDKVDPFVSVYQPPTPSIKSNNGTLVKFKGLIPTTCIQNIMIIIRKMMNLNITSEWVSLSCWGYKDSPFTWNNMGHYQYLNGENDYTFLLLPNKKTAYTYQLYGSHHATLLK